MSKCPFCQFENEDGALFCEQCKSDLGVTEPTAVQAGSGSAQSASVAQGPAMSNAAVAAVALAEAPVRESVPMAQVDTSASAGAAEPIAVAVPLSEPTWATPAAAEGSPVASPVAAPDTAPDTSSPISSPPEESTQPPGAAEDQSQRLPTGAKPKLVVLRGQRLHVEYPIYEGDNYLGRADEKAVDIDLEDQEPPDRIWSSRQHARISYEDGLLTIEDLNSTNGTFVNRLRVHPGQKRPLQVNDIIQIGTVQLKVKT